MPPPPSATAESAAKADGVDLGKPLAEPELQVLPIDLATALQLSGSRPIDVQLAQEGVRGASASLLQARALWLPTITIGGDYYRHDGDLQDSSGVIVNDSHSSLMFGLGSGIGTSAILSPNDAIFASLAARQTLSARRSEVQAATNDSMLAVTNAYFSVQQARGELAAAQDATRRTEEIVRRVKSLAAGLLPPLEIVRAETELARRQEAEIFARENWQVSGSELARILRLDAAAQLEPVEPPQLNITLVEPDRPIDELITIGLSNRPELAADQALVQAALARLKQEKLRPFIPSILLRGDSTSVGGTLGAGVFAGGTNGDLGSTAGRSDWDLQVLWQLDNLGVGNVARTRVRDSEHRAAILELSRQQDRVAAEVCACLCTGPAGRPPRDDFRAAGAIGRRLVQQESGRTGADPPRGRAGADDCASARGNCRHPKPCASVRRLFSRRGGQQPGPVPSLPRDGPAGAIAAAANGDERARGASGAASRCARGRTSAAARSQPRRVSRVLPDA